MATPRRTTSKTTSSLLAAVVILAAATTACSFEISTGDITTDGIDGSGAVVTQTYELDAFTAVTVGTIFDADVIVGDAQSIEITADDNLFELLDVTVDGDVLTLDTKPGISIGKATTFEARIVTPDLEAFTATGVANAAVSGIDTEDFALEASDATTVDFSGTVDHIDVLVSGVSNVAVAGDISSATVEADGTSELDFGNTPLQQLDVDIDGVSTVKARAADEVAGDVDGVSTLEVAASTTLDVQTSGQSQIKRR